MSRISRKNVNLVLKNYGQSVTTVLKSYAEEVDLPVTGAPKKKLLLDIVAASKLNEAPLLKFEDKVSPEFAKIIASFIHNHRTDMALAQYKEVDGDVTKMHPSLHAKIAVSLEANSNKKAACQKRLNGTDDAESNKFLKYSDKMSIARKERAAGIDLVKNNAILSWEDKRADNKSIALLDRRENGSANMKPENEFMIRHVRNREKLAIEKKLANVKIFDINQCSKSTIDNHTASLNLLNGDFTSIGPLFRRTPGKPDCVDEYAANGFDRFGKGDFDVLQQTYEHRSSLMSHWTTVGPDHFQLTDKERYLIPCRDLTNETIESASILHVGATRHEYVYFGPTFLGAGLFYANKRGEYYPIVEGAVFYVYLIGPNNPQFEHFYQTRAGKHGGIGMGCEYLAKTTGRVMPDACIQVTLGVGGSIKTGSLVLIRIKGDMDTPTHLPINLFANEDANTNVKLN